MARRKSHMPYCFPCVVRRESLEVVESENSQLKWLTLFCLWCRLWSSKNCIVGVASRSGRINEWQSSIPGLAIGWFFRFSLQNRRINWWISGTSTIQELVCRVGPTNPPVLHATSACASDSHWIISDGVVNRNRKKWNVLACIASVSVGLGSKERPRNGTGTVFCPREMGREPSFPSPYLLFFTR